MDRFIGMMLVLALAAGCAPAVVENTASAPAAVIVEELVPVDTPVPTPIQATATPRSYIPAAQAADYARQVMLVKLDPAYCSYEPEVNGNPTFCNDQPYPNHNFTLLVWDQDWSFLDGKCLLVEGEIEMYEGRPEIIAENLDQVYECP